MPKNHIHRAMHYRETFLKKIENFVLFGAFISKIKTIDIFNFLSVKHFGKGLLFPKIWHVRVNCCWSNGPSNLLFRFFHYRLSHFETGKNSRKLKNTLFWKLIPKQVFVESLKFFDPPTTKWWSLKFFVKLIGNHILMSNFSKLCKY